MFICLNEKPYEIEKGDTAFFIKEKVKKEADLVILNGFPIQGDMVLQEKDNLVLIQKGEIPQKEELEFLLTSRHTPRVHEKIKNSIVGIAGLGGLGSNVAVSLTRLGIGKLILVDFDVVEPSNLNRQQYFIKHIGMKKTQALKEILKQINPFVEVEIVDAYLGKENIKGIFQGAEIIVEAFDNSLCKAELVNTVLVNLPEKYVVAASGMAGYFSNNTIQTKRKTKRLYVVGDEEKEAKIGCGLMAPRVAIAANHQANMVLRILLGEEET